jgi:hypothetical protein
MKIIEVINQKTKIPFTVTVIFKGEKHGLNDCLTHENEIPLVEFFDARYNHTQYGQFTGGSYFATTLLGLDGYGGTEIGQYKGLCLDGDIPQWYIDAGTCKLIATWLKNVLVLEQK